MSNHTNFSHNRSRRLAGYPQHTFECFVLFKANQHWLLVHGWLDNSNSWIHLAPLLADRLGQVRTG